MALKKCLSDGRLVPKVNRLLNKDCRQSTYPAQLNKQLMFFNAKYALTSINSPPYTPSAKKEVLIN